MSNLVDRATSDMLGGPDWAMNMELCDIINNDPGHAKDAVKAVKKRLGNKNPKIQLLTLTVLETMIKNCGDIVHHQVAGKDVLHEMVKIAKKNKNMEVRDRILSMIDTWQEAFGGPRGRYPQYFMAYDELRRSGVVFPRRAETASPIYTPPQTHPIASTLPSPPRSPNYLTSRMEASTPPELAGLSLTDIQNARGGMEVLTEMLNAINPGDKLALRGEVIIELVEQCRTAERRVMQLVNSTSDEELLRQGLSLNDDLKRVLQRHDAIASGAPISQDTPTAPPLLIDTHQQADSDYGLSQLPQRSTSNVRPQSQTSSSANTTQLALPAPAQSQKKATPSTTLAPTVDLLSGDAFVENSQPSAPAASPSAQHIQPSLLTLAQPGASNLFGSNESFQAAPSMPFFYSSSQQHQQSYPQSNGAVVGQSGMPFQHNSYNQVQQVQTPTQSVGQFHENNYITPWAHPSGPSLSPQQQALIYGAENSTDLQSPQNPQQLALGYGAQLPSVSQPAPLQAYSSYLQPQQVYGSSQVQPQQNLSASSYAYGSPQGQPHLGFNQQSPKSHLPPAPWSTESPQADAPLSQQTSHLYGNAILSSLPQSSVQYPDRQQLFQQQQQFFAAGQLNPQITAGQFVPQIGEANLSAQMQNLSFQRSGGYYSPMQSTGQYMQQAEFPFHQKQAAPMKETKPEDKLFKDLVDFSKSNKGGTSNK